MLLTADIKLKKLGHRILFRDLKFVINPGEKLAIVGRNGVGKTTLFNMLTGMDKEFEGEIRHRRGLQMAATKQEHFPVENQTAIDYILDNLPDYRQLQTVIEHHPAKMSSDVKKIAEYTEAVEEFTRLGYYDIQAKALRALEAYQIDAKLAAGDFATLSGGQKRFVDLVRVELSEADLALTDEPTNHMDYAAKATFIDWLKSTKRAVAVITHDRDVLGEVDRILEIRDQTIYSFPGNYDAYLEQNSSITVGQINDYEVAQRTIRRLEIQIKAARAKKPSWHGTADKKNPFVAIEERLTKQVNKLKEEVAKPSFWIDRESVEELRDDVVEKYDKYKAKNIKIGAKDGVSTVAKLLEVKDLSLGFDHALFDGVNFSMSGGDRIQIKGRNGVGKTTLVRAIIASIEERELDSKAYGGWIHPEKRINLGVYHQEVETGLLKKKLGEAVAEILDRHNQPVTDTRVRQLLAQYLFDPVADYPKPVSMLSGGEKARLQLIGMLASRPNLLILDEPTNHLDLPSIEELENALVDYHGAIIFISHDSYFARYLGGQTLEIP